MKAGIMEIGDCFLVNNADRERTDRAVSQIQSILALKEFGEGDWSPPVLRTVATTGDGLEELVGTIDRHLDHLVATGEMERFRLLKSQAEFMAVLEETLSQYVLEEMLSDGALERIVESIASRELDPYTAVEEIMARLQA